MQVYINIMDYMDQLNHWADMYEKAQADGVFQSTPKPPQMNTQTGSTSFFGLVNTEPTEEVSDVDAKYWSQVYERTVERCSPFGSIAGEIEVLHEDGDGDGDGDGDIAEAPIAEDKSYVADVAQSMLDSPNPVHPSSVGKDQELTVTPNWGTVEDDSVDSLVEIEKLKKNLYDLECKLSGPDGLKESAPKIDKQLETMKKKIDDLSNRLNPNYWRERET